MGDYPYLGIMLFMGFNENLKGELGYKGISVKELAHTTGIPKKTIDNYLLSSSSNMPTADRAVAIARALGVTVEYLVTGKAPPRMDQNLFFSPELRSIADRVEPLSREKRKVVEATVAELVRLLRHPFKDEPAALSPLQKVFIRLFR